MEPISREVYHKEMEEAKGVVEGLVRMVNESTQDLEKQTYALEAFARVYINTAKIITTMIETKKQGCKPDSGQTLH